VHHEPAMAHGGSSPESDRDGALAPRCSPVAAEKGEGEVANSLGTSPENGRRRDGRAMERGGSDRFGSARAVLRARRGGTRLFNGFP
jgi:hypothetical protein